MSLRELWQSLVGKDDVKQTVKSVVGKDERPGETPQERQRRRDEENSVAASTSPGAF